jgi:hypothetical protein
MHERIQKLSRGECRRVRLRALSGFGTACEANVHAATRTATRTGMTFAIDMTDGKAHNMRLEITRADVNLGSQFTNHAVQEPSNIAVLSQTSMTQSKVDARTPWTVVTAGQPPTIPECNRSISNRLPALY